MVLSTLSPSGAGCARLSGGGPEDMERLSLQPPGQHQAEEDGVPRPACPPLASGQERYDWKPFSYFIDHLVIMLFYF